MRCLRYDVGSLEIRFHPRRLPTDTCPGGYFELERDLLAASSISRFTEPAAAARFSALAAEEAPSVLSL